MNDATPSPLVKILLDVETEDGTAETESVWALPQDGGFRIDNIPFYARGFAYGDVVSATQESDGLYRANGLLAPSGHSTIRLWFADSATVQPVRDKLRSMGCASELDLEKLVAVDVPANVPYAQVKAFLDGMEAAQILEYEEGCLSQS